MKNHWWKDRNEQIAQQCINQGVNESVSHSFLDPLSSRRLNIVVGSKNYLPPKGWWRAA